MAAMDEPLADDHVWVIVDLPCIAVTSIGLAEVLFSTLRMPTS